MCERFVAGEVGRVGATCHGGEVDKPLTYVRWMGLFEGSRVPEFFERRGHAVGSYS